MSNDLTTTNKEQALAKVILEGDLSKLKPEEKVLYYKQVCNSVGLNPLTQPLAFIKFQGKEVLYAGKNCTEQLRDINGISLKITSRDKIDDLYIVTAEATNKHGRHDSSTGAVNLKGLSGADMANAVMKAETKAKRRVTLSISGLGFLDESETDSIPGAQKLNVDMETGEILDGELVKQEALQGLSKTQYIDPAQVITINKLVYDAKLDEKEFLESVGVATVGMITTEFYPRVVKKLERTIEAKKPKAVDYMGV
jgi:hypothetical protein